MTISQLRVRCDRDLPYAVRVRLGARMAVATPAPGDSELAHTWTGDPSLAAAVDAAYRQAVAGHIPERAVSYAYANHIATPSSSRFSAHDRVLVLGLCALRALPDAEVEVTLTDTTIPGRIY